MCGWFGPVVPVAGSVIASSGIPAGGVDEVYVDGRLILGWFALACGSTQSELDSLIEKKTVETAAQGSQPAPETSQPKKLDAQVPFRSRGLFEKRTTTGSRDAVHRLLVE